MYEFSTGSRLSSLRQALLVVCLLVLVVGATAAVTFGITRRWVEGQVTITRQQIQRDTDAQRQRIELERQTRLASIERRSGDASFTYFDVTSLIADAAQVQKLSADHEYLPGLGCYVPRLERAGWKRETLDESELIGRIVGAGVAKEPSKTPRGEAIEQSLVYLWSRPDEIAVALNQEGLPTVRLFPFVTIQTFSNGSLQARIGSTPAKPRQDRLERMRQTESLLELLTKAALKESPPLDVSTIEKPTEPRKLAALQELGRLFRSDVACFLLSAQLRQLYEFALNMGNATVHLTQADRKGNLLYLHAAVAIDEGDAKESVYWDREWFLVTLPDRSFLITSSAPSRNRFPPSADWITAWLTGIKVASSTAGDPVVARSTLGTHASGEGEYASIAHHPGDETRVNYAPFGK